MHQDDKQESKADVIFHPVRFRIVQALFGGRRLTAGQLVKILGGAVPGDALPAPE